MDITEGVEFNPKQTLATLQFRNEYVNNAIISVVTTLLIASLRSIVHRMVVVSAKDVFRFSAYTRAFVFESLGHPTLILSWLRGRYAFRVKDGSHSKLRVRCSTLIVPLVARCIILVISSASFFFAIPMVKKIDGCSGGDFVVYQERLRGPPPELSPTGIQFCVPLPMNTTVGEMISSLSVCSSFALPGMIDDLNDIVDMMELGSIPGAILVSHEDQDLGALFSTLVSERTAMMVFSVIEWKLSNGDILRSTVSDYDPFVHLDVVLDAVRLATNSRCGIIGTVSDAEDKSSLTVALDCSFDPTAVSDDVMISVTHSLRFRKQDDVAWRFRMYANRTIVREQVCGAEVTLNRPLVNLFPLVIASVVAFALSRVVARVLTCRTDVTHHGFHMVRELLGHDTSANPLQATEQERGEEVAMRRYACADGTAAHVGFLEGEGDEQVQQFDERRHVSSCAQVACAGRRFVRTTQRGGSPL